MLWGTTGTAQTFATLSMSSYWIGTARLVVSAIFFALCIAVFDRQALAKERLARMPWKLILIAAISMCVYNLAFFAGVRSAGVAVGTALALGSGPVWAGLLQALWLRRMPSMVWWFAISVAIAGLILASSDSLTTTSDAATTGLILCLISGLSYAMFALVTKQAVAMAPASMVTAMTAAVLLAGIPVFNIGDLPVMLWLGVIATGVAYLLFSLGVQHVSSATSVALALAEPITAVVLAIIIVGEQPSNKGLFGMVIVFIGLVLIVRAELTEAIKNKSSVTATS
jgi:DME family drug/metabolite transporter